LKLRYIYAGIFIALIGIIISLETPLISNILLTKTEVVDIPRKDFRLNIERVWKNDLIRLEIEVEGEEEDIYIEIERVHFYIGQRTEGGVPTSLYTKILYGPEKIEKSELLIFEIDVGGHLNIIMNNTASLYPKTVKITKVFEYSTNVRYTTSIIRNLSLVSGVLLFIFGIVENYEEIEKIFKKNN